MQTKTEIFDSGTGEIIDSPVRLQRRVRNWLNYQDELIIHEVNTQPSLTVPDQTMDVKTILDRHTRGLGLGNMTTPVYNLDEEGNELIPVDWQRLDISERHERLAQAKAYTARLRKNYDDAQKQKESGSGAAKQAQEAISASSQGIHTTTDVPVEKT